MECLICFECDHVKEDCPFHLKAPIGVNLWEIPLEPEDFTREGHRIASAIIIQQHVRKYLVSKRV